MEWMIGLKRYSVMKITNLHYQGDAIPWEEKKKKKKPLQSGLSKGPSDMAGIDRCLNARNVNLQNIQ